MQGELNLKTLLHNKVFLFLIGLCAIPFGVYLFLKVGLLPLIALILAPFVVIIAFFYPSLLLALLIVSTILQEVIFVEILQVATINQILGIVLISVSLIKSVLERNINKLNHSITFLLLAFFVILILSYLLFSKGHENPLTDIDHYFRSYVYFIICLLVIRDKKDLAYIVSAFIIAGLMVMFSGFYWKAIFTPIDYFSSSGRTGISGITGHYIEYSIRCMIPLPILLYIFINKSLSYKKYFNGFLLLIIVNLSVALLLSGSRGAVLAYLFLIVFLAILSRMSIPRKIAIASTFLLIPLFLPINEILNQIFSLFKAQLPVDISAAMRKYLYIQLFSHFSLGSLLWGHGLENFRDYYSGVFRAPHSVWGQIYFELGLLGLGLHLFLVSKIAQIFMKLRKREIDARVLGLETSMTLGCGISIFVLLFWGLYENVGFIIGSKHLFILLGTFVAGSRISAFKNNE